MSDSTLTKRIEFSASHRYYQKAWDEATNYKVFGPCVQEHGHNYLLEVTLGGPVDTVTGMIINLYDLKIILTDVLEEFDHKHLNLDTQYFDDSIPTTENLALVLWRKFRHRLDTQNITKLTLFEGTDLWAEIKTPPNLSLGEEPPKVSVSRRYRFSFVHQPPTAQPLGWHVTLSITVCGTIDPLTGRVTDIAKLDELIFEHVIHPLSGKDPYLSPSRSKQPATLGHLLQTMWAQINPLYGGRLVSLMLQDPSGTVLEFTGSEKPQS